MTVKGGTSPACAACKFQRRKCSSECPLAPYFPPDQPNLFQNAHRLFGVSKILKILRQLDPSQRTEAMRSILYESNTREKYPTHGCYGIVLQLQYQIHQVELERDAVNTQLAICKHRHQQMQHSPSSQLQLGTTSDNNALPLFQNHPIETGISLAPHHLSHSFSNGTYNTSTAYIDSNENIMNSLWIQPYNNNNINNSAEIQSQLITEHVFPLQQQAVEESQQDYDEMPAFFDAIDDRQSYIDSKEAYDSSSESSMKDMKQSTIEHVAENELKSAAARLSLTSVEQLTEF